MATQQHTSSGKPSNDKHVSNKDRDRGDKPAAPKQEAKPMEAPTSIASNGSEKVKHQVTETDVTPAAATKSSYTLDEKRALLAKVLEHEPELDKVRAELEAAQNKLKTLEQSRSSDIEALYNAMGGKPFNITGGRSAKCVKRAYKNEDAVSGQVTTNVRWYFEIDTPETL